MSGQAADPGRRRLSVAEVDGLDAEAFVTRFAAVYEDSPWVAAGAWERRPFGSLDALHAAMEAVVRDAPDERRLALLRAHPDLAGRAAMAGELGPESTREQVAAGLDRLTRQQYDRITALTRDYRERHGFPFIVCAREHTPDTIVADAERRLGEPTEAEIATALAEVGKIARLRIADLVDGAAP